MYSYFLQRFTPSQLTIPTGKVIANIILSRCWKFTITGANHNSELKLWSCETWSCLQTIHFKPDPTNLIQSVYLKMCIDYSGQYLVLSDLNNKALYVLQLKRNDEAQQIYVTMLAQFLLPTAFLSFHITEASCRKLRSSDVSEEEDQEEEDDEEDDSRPLSIIIKMLVIQPKKFQECNVLFQKESILSKNDIIIKKEIEVPLESKEKIPKLDDLQGSVTLLIQQQQQQQLNLMPPEAFTTAETPSSRPSSPGNDDLIKTDEPSEGDNLIDFQRPEKDNFASGGSSPSREVQEILALNNSSTYNTQDYFDNLTKIEEQEIPQKEYNSENLIYPENSHPDIAWLKMPPLKEEIKEDGVKQDLRLGGGDEITNDTEWNKSQIQALNFRMTGIENAINDQNLLIGKIHQELKASNKTAKEEFHADVTKEMNLAMSKQKLQIAKMLENLVNMQKNNGREEQEHMIANISQIVTKAVSDKLQSAVAHEMKHVVVPNIRNIVDALRHHMDVQNSQKLNSDMVLQDKISKMINSKVIRFFFRGICLILLKFQALAESLSLSVANVITPILEKCYREMITSTLVPSWEKVCGTMFHQINETFTQGTKECIFCASFYFFLTLFYRHCLCGKLYGKTEKGTRKRKGFDWSNADGF